jgi:glucosamine 6-phosphate synthetase-like amidotransferase/phosphosugar isomerase protein
MSVISLIMKQSVDTYSVVSIVVKQLKGTYALVGTETVY